MQSKPRFNCVWVWPLLSKNALTLGDYGHFCILKQFYFFLIFLILIFKNPVFISHNFKFISHNSEIFFFSVAETRLDIILISMFLCKQTYSEAARCQVVVSFHCILFESTLSKKMCK